MSNRIIAEDESVMIKRIKDIGGEITYINTNLFMIVGCQKHIRRLLDKYRQVYQNERDFTDLEIKT